MEYTPEGMRLRAEKLVSFVRFLAWVRGTLGWAGFVISLVSDTLGGGMVMESGSIIGSVTKFVGKLGGYSLTTLKN